MRGPFDLVVTSPPYWRRRDYGHPEQLGQEATPGHYIRTLVRALNGWGRCLASHGAVVVNLGDTYLDGGLVGIPARFEIAARAAGWRVLNHVVWTKTTGVPQPLSYRLASRHEALFHLTRAPATEAYVDLYALGRHLGRPANAGDAWHLADAGGDGVSAAPDDAWALAPSPSRSGHPAPFPPELVRRVLHLAAPPRVCTACSRPFRRMLAASANLDSARPQASQAMRRFQQAGLTDAHLAAIRAVGISDAGMGRRLQDGAGKNRPEVQRLADEAKAALGGYFREFTFAPKTDAGWASCACGAPTRPGRVLDPFAGSGTTLAVAATLGFDAIGVDLCPPPGFQP